MSVVLLDATLEVAEHMTRMSTRQQVEDSCFVKDDLDPDPTVPGVWWRRQFGRDDCNLTSQALWDGHWDLAGHNRGRTQGDLRGYRYRCCPERMMRTHRARARARRGSGRHGSPEGRTTDHQSHGSHNG